MPVRITTRIDRARRRMLKRIGLAGAAVVAAGPAVRLVAAPTTGEPVSTKPSRPGYRETPHVRKYYEKARS